MSRYGQLKRPRRDFENQEYESDNDFIPADEFLQLHNNESGNGGLTMIGTNYVAGMPRHPTDEEIQ